MRQSESVRVKAAMAVLEGFEVNDRQDQIGLMAAVSVIRARKLHYEKWDEQAGGMESLNGLRDAGSGIYNQYFSERLKRLGGKPTSKSFYDLVMSNAVTEQDTRDAHQLAQQLAYELNLKKVKTPESGASGWVTGLRRKLCGQR